MWIILFCRPFSIILLPFLGVLALIGGRISHILALLALTATLLLLREIVREGAGRRVVMAHLHVLAMFTLHKFLDFTHVLTGIHCLIISIPAEYIKK